MKRKKGFSIILIIPIIVLVLAIGGVFMYKLYSEGTRAKASETPIEKTMPPLSQTGKKPSTGYGQVQSPTFTPTPAPAQTDLDDILKETDDGAEAELKSLDATASKL